MSQEQNERHRLDASTQEPQYIGRRGVDPVQILDHEKRRFSPQMSESGFADVGEHHRLHTDAQVFDGTQWTWCVEWIAGHPQHTHVPGGRTHLRDQRRLACTALAGDGECRTHRQPVKCRADLRQLLGSLQQSHRPSVGRPSLE